jgi:hypothetical protein
MEQRSHFMQKSQRLVELPCHELKSKQKMTRIGLSGDRGMVWFRCHGCGTNHAFPYATMMRDGFIPQSKKEKANNGVEPLATGLIEYSPSGVYRVGQWIHHAVLDDQGKVIAENTANGHGKIVVAFEKSGKKILLHALSDGLVEYAR